MHSFPPRSRTRLAPTPSGFLHLGNICSFHLTAVLARRSGAAVFLRIDDLDRERFRREYLEDIFETLDFLGISRDEGPVSALDFEAHWTQAGRLPLYEKMLDRLVETDAVFACRCSRREQERAGLQSGCAGNCKHERLPLETPGLSWRLQTSGVGPVAVMGYSGDAQEASLPASMNEFIVRKKDGQPAYQLTSLVDDLHFGVDLIVRGSDLWPSTIAQLVLARLLAERSFLDTRFVHHPLLEAHDGTKLSKSAGAGSIRDLRLRGYGPEAILAMTAPFLKRYFLTSV